MYSDDYDKLWGADWIAADPTLQGEDSLNYSQEYQYYTPRFLIEYVPKGNTHYCPTEPKSDQVGADGERLVLREASKPLVGGLDFWPHYRLNPRWLDRRVDGEEACSCHNPEVAMKRHRWLHYLFRDMDYGAHGNVKYRDRASNIDEKAGVHAVVFCDSHVETLKGKVEGQGLIWRASEGQ